MFTSLAGCDAGRQSKDPWRIEAKKTGRPVKLEFTREENFLATHHRYPTTWYLKYGVKKDGMLTAMHVRLYADLGAYYHMELDYIREQKNGLSIGAATTISDIAASPLVAARYSLLARAAGQVAGPQIRNVGTLGGNLCQRPRCWYFRGKAFKDCFRKGGANCYAPTGENQYHAIFGGENCYMVCPSDMAPALAALNARVVIATTKGNKLIPIEQFYIRPGKNILKETMLGPAEMAAAVEIPVPASGSKGTYKVQATKGLLEQALGSLA